MAAQALPLLQARPEGPAGTAEAAADVRDLGVLAARRRRAPAHGQGGARRHPLVGSPRGLPHGGPRPDEGPEREEHADRAGRRQGRLRAEADAPRRGSRGSAARRHRVLSALHPRPARPERQRRRAVASSRPARPCATTRTIRTSSWPPTRVRRRSPTLPMRSRPNTASGSATRSPPAARPVTTTRRWASPPRARGNASRRHFREMGIDTQSQDFTVAGIGDMAGDVFGNGMLLSKHIRLVAAFNHQHILLDPDPDRCAQLQGARADVQPAPLVVERLRQAHHLQGRRHFPA